ncbi:MAG: YbaY family lipoprotein, partial [Chloroflexota bacterium]
MRHAGRTRMGGLLAAGIMGLLALATLATAGLVAAQAPVPTVTGRIVTKEPNTLASGAIAHVLLVDRSARGGAAVVAGVRRSAAGTATPVRFSVAYDAASIDGSHAYVAFAALADGSRRWQSADGVPVITGGPTDGVEVRVRSAGALAGVVTARVERTDKGTLSGKAVAWAALLDTESGRIVGWTVASAPPTGPAEVAIGYDPTLVDPAVPLAVWAAVTDGTRVRALPSARPVRERREGDVRVAAVDGRG